jgi:outer membrane protein
MRSGRNRHRIALLCLCVLVAADAPAEDLLSLYRSVLTDNPQLRARELGVVRAGADTDVARSKLYPQISLQSSASANDYTARYPTRSLNENYAGNRTVVSARQALLDIPSFYRVRGSEAVVMQAGKEAEQVRAELFGQLADQYLNALQAQDELAQLQIEIEAAERQVDRLRAMREREMATVTDLAEAISWRQQLATREIDARNKADAARVRLREMTGRDPGELSKLVVRDFPAVPGSELGWVDAVLSHNAMVASRRAAVDASRLAVDAARAEHLPQVSLYFQRNQSNQNTDYSPLNYSYVINSVGVELVVPIFEGGRVSASTASAVAQLSIANEQLEGARREVERDTRLLFANAGADRARIDSTTAEVDALTYTVKAQQRGYELGVVTVIQVLDARRRLLRSRVDQAKARYDYLRDLIGLKLRAGLTEADVADFNRWLAPREE